MKATNLASTPSQEAPHSIQVGGRPGGVARYWEGMANLTPRQVKRSPNHPHATRIP